MKKILAVLVMCFAGLPMTFAQNIGDSEQKVRAALGTPSIVMDRGGRRIWVYTDGSKVTFERGLVVASTAQAPVAAPSRPSVAPIPVGARPAETQKPAPKPAIRTVEAPASPGVRTRPLERPQNFYAGGGLLLLGAIISFIFGIIIIIQAFKAGIFWGLAVLFFPIAQIIFVATHWAETKKPFLISILVGMPLMIVGGIVAGGLPR